MSEKHTKGPWRVEKAGKQWHIVGNNASFIGVLFEPDEDISDEEAEANARLIELAANKAIVEVRGGVAYCDDPRVEIIDYDNEGR